ncbi:formylglycine-generating enzyme family protein [Planctomycetota bacterium]
MKSKHCLRILLFLYTSVCLANTSPEVTTVSATQRKDGSGIVDIHYTLVGADGDHCTITVLVSEDGGSTWKITPRSSALEGDVGEEIHPGQRHIEWASKEDLWGRYGTNYRVRLIADDKYVAPPPLPTGMELVRINDPGVSGHEGFNGQMSKYETTNAQYCQYLNAALATGDITVSGEIVIGANGSNGGTDYTALEYYYCNGKGFTAYGATNGGVSSIHYSAGRFSVTSGFGNHPVNHVSWYGASAFAAYYDTRLPTEWEWQAVADYDGSYTYGCGPIINSAIANCKDSTHPDGTTPVGHFGTYGYGLCDIAGNVMEWTSTIYAGKYRHLCGGSWMSYGRNCAVEQRFGDGWPWLNPVGFRVCSSVSALD